MVLTVLKRNVTCEELLSPGAPFIKRVLTVSYKANILYVLPLSSLVSIGEVNMYLAPSYQCFASQVMGDAVGWGFVIRGVAPVYVQAVDPGSPAAAAGVKVTQTHRKNSYTQ